MKHTRRNNQQAFTLIELLVVIGIIVTLTAILIPSLSKARQYARTCHALSALRQIDTGYLLYAQENDNRLLQGELPFSNPAPIALVDENGTSISNAQARARWPWRLFNYGGRQSMNFVRALYLGERYQNLFVNNQDKRQTDTFMWQYITSQSPSFGLNMFNLGGYITASNGTYLPARSSGLNGPYCLTKSTEAVNPGRLITFASARNNLSAGGDSIWTTSAYGKQFNEGSDRIICPSRSTYNSLSNTWNAAEQWSTNDYSDNSDGDKWGYVHPRYNGKAAVAFLDGHVETLTLNELRDNSLWINQP